MEAPASRPEWASQLFQTLKVKPGEAPASILEGAEAVANQLAPNTRRMWNLILFFQGIAILAPLFWLVVVRERLSVPATAYGVVFCTLLVVGICWWVRWRGMQHTWARARMVAEIARSGSVTCKVAPSATPQALAGAPGLQAVAEWILPTDDKPEADLDLRKEAYLKERIRDQLEYYRRKRGEAGNQRRGLSRVVTASLDAALFLAAAGLAISFREDPSRWINWSGSDYILGFVGAGLPMLAVLAQLRGAYLELDRRVGRYAQQIEFLESAERQAQVLESESEFNALVTEVERTLLGEVVEWFYQAEHTEPYYRSKVKDLDERDLRDVATGKAGLLSRIWSGVEYSAGFLGRVLFGRVLVVSASVVLTTLWINYQRGPDDPTIHASLRVEDGRLLSPNPGGPYTFWDPQEPNADSGFILIAHGLRDGVDFEATGEHWMTQMETTLRDRFGNRLPDICLVDWHYSSEPSNDPSGGMVGSAPMTLAGMPPEVAKMANDLTIIRAQGERIGELVGFKLARAIRNKELRQDRPMHFIGHSAGGFVVSQAARVLIELDLAPEDFRITLLDTPLPRVPDLEFIGQVHPIDFYATSQFAQLVPPDRFAPLYRRFAIQPPAGTDPLTGAHSFAHQWFIQTILEDEEGLGFSRSPFAEKTN